MGARSRRKGKVGERELGALLAAAFDTDVRRGWQSRNGTDEADLEGLPWWPEVKRQKRPNVAAAIRQAVADTDGRPPVAFTRADRDEWLVTMRLGDWIDAVRRATP